MTALRAPLMILGYISALFGLSALYEAPDASESILEAPPSTMQVYEYGEGPAPELTGLTPVSSTTNSLGNTPVSSTTTVWVEPQPKSECEIALQTALDVGWPAKELAKLAVIMWRESRCSPSAHNAKDPGSGSYSLLQINSYWCEPNRYWPQGWLQAKGIVTTCTDLYDPATNLRAGLAIWRNSSWQPWSKNG